MIKGFLCASVATLTVQTAAVAQTSTSDAAAQSEVGSEAESGIADIVVTAQKRSERLTDVPLSITAVGGNLLAQQGITSVEQLDKVVPGFTYQKAVYGAPVFALRGIGFYDTSVTNTPAVAVYIDQVPLPYSAMARGVGLDLERVEVLKGPQGTLFGQNSTGGAINYIAAKPTDKMVAGFDLEVGRFNEVNAQAFIGGALSENLRGRIVVRQEYRDDWQKGYEANDNQFGQSNAKLGERRFYNARGQLDWTPTERLTLALAVTGWRDLSDTQAAQFVRFVPTTARNPFNGVTYNAYQPLTQTPSSSRLAGWNAGRDYARDDYYYQPSLRADLELNDTVTLTSISAYSRYHERSDVDADGTAYFGHEQGVRVDINAYFQELRIGGKIDRLTFTLGGNYSREITKEAHENSLGSSNNGVGPLRYNGTRQFKNQRTETWAIFGSADYDLTDHLTLQGALRYTTQDRSYRGCLADNGNGQLANAFATAFNSGATAGNCVTMDAPGSNRAVSVVADELNQDNLSWRGSLRWKPTSNSMIYGSVTKGYKAGSYPIIPSVYAFQVAPVPQESLLAYEIGFKTDLANRKVQLTGSVFYYDYKDKQLLGYLQVPPFGNLPSLVRFPKSRVKGAELETTIYPFDGLRISAGITYVDSLVKTDPTNPIDAFGRSTSFVGESFPNTPKWQGVADTEYRFAAGATTDLFVGGSVSARSRTQAAFGELPDFYIDGYALLDLRAGIEAQNKSWRVQVYGRNVTGTKYQTNIMRQIDSLTYYMGMPATYGVSFGYRY